MASKKVRVCVVGMGIGRPNGQALARNPRGEVVALCDLDEDRMKDFANSLPNKDNIKFYTDYKKMCKDKEIDAVFVGTPNQWHVPIALEAVKNDKHVMVTKPLADSEQAAKKLVKAAESAGVVNMMSLSTRFDKSCTYLGNMAREGQFGEIYYARARSVRRSGIPAWNLGFIKKGGGAFRDMGVHVLDAIWWVMGLPKPSAQLVSPAQSSVPEVLDTGIMSKNRRRSMSSMPPMIMQVDSSDLRTGSGFRWRVSGHRISLKNSNWKFLAQKQVQN